MENQLFSMLEDDFPVFLQTFQEFVQTPSVSGDDAQKYGHPEKILKVLQKTCEEWNLDLEIIENEVAEVSLGKGKKEIGVLLHLDVVPAGGNWKEPAFSGKVVDDEVWGRGTWDNKQPLVIFLFALYLFKKHGLQFKRRARLIMGTHEETGDWSDIHLYLEKKNPPDFCLVPDGSFPIGIAEKGFANMEIEGHEEWTCSRFTVVSLKAGERVNMVPDNARLEMQFSDKISDKDIGKWIEQLGIPSHVTPPDREIKENNRVNMNFYGQCSHSSAPANGVNALLFAFRFLQVVCRYYEQEVFPLLSLMETLTADIKGQKIGYAADDDFLGPTTGSVGLFSYESAALKCVQNLRPTKGTTCRETAERVKQGIRKLVPEKTQLHINMRKRFKEPLYVDPDENEQYLIPLREVYQTVTGRKPKYIGTAGSTYAKAMPNSILFGPLEEEDGEIFHQPNERVSFDRLKKNMRLYISALYKLLEPV